MIEVASMIEVAFTEDDVAKLLGYLNRVPIVGFADAEGILVLRAKLMQAIQAQQQSTPAAAPPDGGPPSRGAGAKGEQ